MWLRSAKFILVPMVALLVSYAACAEHEAAPRPLPTGPPIVVVEFRSELLWAPRFLLYRDGTAIGTTARDIQAAIKTHTPLTMRHARLTDRERDDLVRAVQNVLRNGGTTRYRVERASDIPHYVLSADAPGTIEVSGRIEGLRGWLNRRALPPSVRALFGTALGMAWGHQPWPVAQLAVRLKPWTARKPAQECSTGRTFPFITKSGQALVIGMDAAESDLFRWFGRCTYVGVAGGQWEYSGYEPIVPGWSPFSQRN